MAYRPLNISLWLLVGLASAASGDLAAAQDASCEVPVDVTEAAGSIPAAEVPIIVAHVQAGVPTPEDRRECSITILSYGWFTNPSIKWNEDFAANYVDYTGPGSAVVDPKSADASEDQATLSVAGLKPGYYEVTFGLTATWRLEQKDAACGDCFCSGCESGYGSVTVRFEVLSGQYVNDFELDSEGFSPDPVCACTVTTCTVTAEALEGICEQETPVWAWAIEKVEYAGGSEVGWAEHDYRPQFSPPAPSGSSASLSAQFPAAGHWRVTVFANVTGKLDGCTETFDWESRIVLTATALAVEEIIAEFEP